jgi:hypothetical protein
MTGLNKSTQPFSDSSDPYGIALMTFRGEVDRLKSEVSSVQRELLNSYPREGFESISRFFEEIGQKFIRYTTIKKLPHYRIIHGSKERKAACRRASQKAKALARAFEKYAKKPALYSRVNSRLEIEPLLGELQNIADLTPA